MTVCPWRSLRFQIQTLSIEPKWRKECFCPSNYGGHSIRLGFPILSGSGICGELTNSWVHSYDLSIAHRSQWQKWYPLSFTGQWPTYRSLSTLFFLNVRFFCAEMAIKIYENISERQNTSVLLVVMYRLVIEWIAIASLKLCWVLNCLNISLVYKSVDNSSSLVLNWLNIKYDCWEFQLTIYVKGKMVPMFRYDMRLAIHHHVRTVKSQWWNVKLYCRYNVHVYYSRPLYDMERMIMIWMINMWILLVIFSLNFILLNW